MIYALQQVYYRNLVRPRVVKIHWLQLQRLFGWHFFCLYLFCSARSRVRGTLEVYHAFIRDLDASDTSSSINNEPDWELVNEGETEQDAESIAHSQVSRISKSRTLTPHFHVLTCFFLWFSIWIERLCNFICCWSSANRLGGTTRCKRYAHIYFALTIFFSLMNWSEFQVEPITWIILLGQRNGNGLQGKVHFFHSDRLSLILILFSNQTILIVFHTGTPLRMPTMILITLLWNLNDVFTLALMHQKIVNIR